jgi:hypothetical protein
MNTIGDDFKELIDARSVANDATLEGRLGEAAQILANTHEDLVSARRRRPRAKSLERDSTSNSHGTSCSGTGGDRGKENDRRRRSPLW